LKGQKILFVLDWKIFCFLNPKALKRTVKQEARRAGSDSVGIQRFARNQMYKEKFFQDIQKRLQP
jgi:hypothetical protein